ncbi:membrane protein [Candidatus Magnetoovum chiemensis]|nr:membrane protein [Candidatus Magnetoovum chiemensis]
MYIEKTKKLSILILCSCLLMYLDQLNLFGYKFNITVFFIYYLTLKNVPETALVFGALIGAVMDSISMKLIGPNILANGAVVFMGYLVKHSMFNLTFLLNSILCFIFTISNGIIVYMSLLIFDKHPIEIVNILPIMLFQAVINGVLAYLFLRDSE